MPCAKAPDPSALVVDPDRLLAALEAGERATHEQHPALAPPRSAEPPPDSERRSDPLPLRDNETAVTTASGVLVIRRRRAA
jgi:hypothetical protein